MTEGSESSELQIAVGPRERAAASRSELYRLFSQVFAYPEDDLAAGLTSGELFEDIGSWPGLPYPFTPATVALPEGNSDDLAVEFTSLFDVAATSPRVPLVEFRYLDRAGSQHAVWEDLLRFYEHFGMNLEAGIQEAPDHLRVELEFLHYLCFLEAGAPEAQVAALRLAEHDFLNRHLLQWVPALAEKVIQAASSPVYVSLAQMLVRFLEADAAYLNARDRGTTR